MRFPKNASLLVTGVLALGLLVYAYVDRNNVTDVERTAREGDLFPAWRRDDVTQIELIFPGETLRLEKRGDDGGAGVWRMTSPRNDTADYASVESLLISLEHGRAARKSSTPLTGTPRAHGKISMGTLTFEFDLGGPAATPEGSSYFQMKGQDAVVISKEMSEALLARSEHYRNRAVVPYLSLQLDEMDVTSSAGDWKLVRMTPIAFKIEPLGVRASRTKIDRAWGALSDMRSEAYLPDEDAKRLTEKPILRIAMKTTDAQKPLGIIRVGAPCPNHPDDLAFYRESPDPVGACIPKGVVERLSAKPEDFADEGAFSYRFDEIEDVILSSGAKTIELARSGSGFHLRAPEDRTLTADEARSVSHLLSVLDKSEGASFVPGFHTDEPDTGRIRVRTSQGDEEVEVGRDHIRRLMDGVVLSASETLTTTILPRETLLRSTRVFPPELDVDEVAALSLECGVTQIFERNPSVVSLQGADPASGGSADHRIPVAPTLARGFVALAPLGFSADQIALTGFAENLTRLRADGWVADADRGAFHTKDSSCKVTFRTKSEGGGGGTHTLALGAPGQGGVFARVDDDPAVAVVPTSIRDLMRAIYMDTELVHPRGGLRKIEATRSGKTTVFARGGSGASGADASRAGAGDETAEAFFEIEGLAFDRVLHLGDPVPEDGMSAPTCELRLTFGTDAGADSVMTITIGARSGAGYTAKTSTARAVYLVAPSKLASFLPPRDPHEPPANADAGASSSAAGDAGFDSGPREAAPSR